MIEPPVLFVCRRGNVRSATAAAIARDYFGLKDVAAVGHDTVTPGFMVQLAGVFPTRYVVGEKALYDAVVATYPQFSWGHIDIGDDRWGAPLSPDLVTVLGVKLLEMFQHPGFPFEEYLAGVRSVFGRGKF